jgi:DnaJ-class molecular chaperone
MKVNPCRLPQALAAIYGVTTPRRMTVLQHGPCPACKGALGGRLTVCPSCKGAGRIAVVPR